MKPEIDSESVNTINHCVAVDPLKAGSQGNVVISRYSWVTIPFYSVLMTALLAMLVTGCSEPVPVLGEASYQINQSTVRCAAGAKPGSSNAANSESTAEGIKFSVRTPLNYDPTIVHPLLMVYAPAKKNRYNSERLMDFTLQATTAGFVVAYADHRGLTPTRIIELSTIPALVAKKWCIDQKRIFLTGHSDGGTVSMALAFMAGTKNIPAAIAPSAVGIRGADLMDRKCPAPIPVMVMHSAKDSLFPGYGMETVLWWASCNQCDLNSSVTLNNGCITYNGCADQSQVWYCEGSGSHSEWPGMNESIIDFFTQVDSGYANGIKG
ncbi:MAG: poly(3-hydroxybutyrate) depolymerase [Gammaproteobacteria bacterium]|nr:poly(3-hydroxybutyrate) depolymerase [Gammaproteobacteria bacterium]